jgi:hypothetical protein
MNVDGWTHSISWRRHHCELERMQFMHVHEFAPTSKPTNRLDCQYQCSGWRVVVLSRVCTAHREWRDSDVGTDTSCIDSAHIPSCILSHRRRNDMTEEADIKTGVEAAAHESASLIAQYVETARPTHSERARATHRFLASSLASLDS